jgi:hypothetical protein
MNVTCKNCGYEKNFNGAEFCDVCGTEIETATAMMPSSSTPLSGSPTMPNPVVNIPAPGTQPATLSPNTPPPAVETVRPSSPPVSIPTSAATHISTSAATHISTSQPSFNVNTATTARLISKQANAPVPQFSIDSAALIGIFDPDIGPVDIDLESFAGGETVSCNHAEIYPEGGIWKIQDLGSKNGVFIKPVGQKRFGARITSPTPINPGDEVAIAKISFVFQSP